MGILISAKLYRFLRYTKVCLVYIIYIEIYQSIPVYIVRCNKGTVIYEKFNFSKMHTKYVAVKRHDRGDLLQNTIAKEKKRQRYKSIEKAFVATFDECGI